MLRLNTFRSLLRRTEHHRPVARSLSLERLEDRTVPSTFTVMNLNDAGAGSLRQAIVSANAAAGADEVAFDDAVRGTIVLATQINIIDDLTISGRGATAVSVSGNQEAAIHAIARGVTPPAPRVVRVDLTIGKFLDPAMSIPDPNKVPGRPFHGEPIQGGRGNQASYLPSLDPLRVEGASRISQRLGRSE